MTAPLSEQPNGAVGAEQELDLTAAHAVAAAEVPPDILADTLDQYLKGWWLRVRSGNSGVLPVVLAIVVVAVSFQITNSKFLSAQNLVNLFEQSTVYMLLAMARSTYRWA
jgi:D-xylose transport system permease protein